MTTLKTTNPFSFSIGIAILTMTIGAPQMEGGSITYSYTGNDFTTPFGSISGFFTPQTGPCISGAPVCPTYDFNGLTNANTFISEFAYTTDPITGAITTWDISIFTCNGPECDGLPYPALETAYEPSPPFPRVLDRFCVSSTSCGSNSGDPGTWTMTPEPSTFVCISPALLALAFVARRRVASRKMVCPPDDHSPAHSTNTAALQRGSPNRRNGGNLYS